MTGKEYVEFRDRSEARIEAIRREVAAACESVVVPPMGDLRPLSADDVRPGLVVYRANGDGWYWHVVETPMHHGDAFKAYVADDGCRFGLDGAYVDREQ